MLLHLDRGFLQVLEGPKDAVLSIFTASIVMNGIPEVCQAGPGFKSTLDLPLMAAKHAVHFK